jgi:hypothetical protein
MPPKRFKESGEPFVDLAPSNRFCSHTVLAKNDSTTLIEAYSGIPTGGRISQARDNIEWNLIAELQ